MRINNLETLEHAVLQKCAVVVPKAGYGKKPLPAAWYFNWRGVCLLHAFRLGMFVYEKESEANDGE